MTSFESERKKLAKDVTSAEEALRHAEKVAADHKENTGPKGTKIKFALVILCLILVVVAVSILTVKQGSVMASVSNWLTEKVYAPEAENDFWLSSIRETMEETPGVMEQLVVYGIAAVICIFLATVVAGFGALVLSVVGFFVGFFICGSGLYDMAYLCIVISGGFAVLKVFLRIKRYSYELRKERQHIQEKLDAVASAEKNLKNAKRKLNTLETKHAEMDALYTQALQQKDHALMERAANMGYEKAVSYLQKEQAKKQAAEAKQLYERATESDTINVELMEQAAELGDPLANLYIAKQIMEEATSGAYTANERENEMRRAADYLHVAACANNREAELLELACRIQFESNSLFGWKSILAKLRQLKKSTDLSSEHLELCDDLIRAVVPIIDNMEEKNTNSYRSEPKVKNTYCAFCNSGICTKLSTGSYLAHCDYMNDPGQCSTALMNKALRFEFV